MARAHYKALLARVLSGFISEDDPVLAMLEWIAHLMMLIEAEGKVGAEKGKHSKVRKTYFSGARVRGSCPSLVLAADAAVLDEE